MCNNVIASAQDEWVVCRVFQKSGGGKRSFLFSDSRVRQVMGYQVDDARSSLPPMADNSPNPTVTDDGTGTDCETCAGTDQMSCYTCAHDFNHYSQTDPHHNKDLPNGVMSWIVQPAGMDNILHPVGGLNNLTTMLSKSYPMYDTFEKTMNMPRLGFTNQNLLQSALKSGDPAQFRVASLRPKTEPSSLCEGEDEAHSMPKVFDYGSLFHSDEPGDDDSSSPLQSSTGGTELSSLSSENINDFTFKYRLQDVAAPVDSAQEILWAY